MLQEEPTPEPTPAQREAERLRKAALTPKERVRNDLSHICASKRHLSCGP
jgi:hypothetical protein